MPPEKCGVGNVVKWVLGIIVTGLFILVGNVVANDNRNTEQHRGITAEMIERDEKMMERLHHFAVRQEVLIKTVGRIESKL